ncbi:hypothetical protein AVEN_187584-1 [Araneus ventricosus]|uniref:Uncharacterized protein n=1 Tax=Araneus ventricosus TaxID=182803 RepID=A0A4Y2FR44_ARAVE|nr:hypothetical protein AVEN_187584-1 [Araneus ventricosus]
MADYYPSEIARLVLGYLKEAHCLKAWETFLVESVDLQEHYRLLQSGRSCSTNIEGKSLLEILHEYRCLKDTAERNARNEANSSSANLNASHSGPSSSNIIPNASHSGPSSSNINPNTSCSENFKTPQKNNAEAFNRFKIHQATQSQATVRFAQGGNQSPRSLQTYLSTPTRPYSSRTPSRLQGVCVTTLNFGTSAERNEGLATVHRGIIETPKRHVYTRTPVRETIRAQRLCHSEPLKRRPATLSRMVQTDSQNTSQIVVDNRSGQTSLDSPSHQRLSGSTSAENSHQLTCSVNSTNYIEDQLHSNNECRNSSDKTNTEENLKNSRSLLPENKSTANSAVVNQTIVFTSTEIRTGGDNESSSTPRYDIEPPPYARAPATDSPRLILSLDRSQVTSLTTPMKDRRLWHEEFASPRRKGTIPRRRLLSESPHPKQISSNDSNFVSIHENVETIIEELMANQPFTQRLADNINKVISEDPEASNSASFPTLQDIQNSDVMIQNIIARAETDSLFNDILSLFGNSRDCDDLNIQESAAETEAVFSITEGTQTNKDESEQALVIELLSSKDEADSAMKHDSAQEKNNEHNSINETSSQLPASSQVFPLSSESAANQSTPTTTNEVPEPMQVDNDKSNLTQESGSKDVLSSCMSIIQPDSETPLQSCNFQQTGDILNNDNDVQSAASIVNESSTLVSASVAENMTRLDDASTLKTVSIGTPLQVGTQIAVSQAASSINQSIPTTQTIICYPSSSLTNSTMPFIPSNRNIPILPAVQNQSFILNSNFQPSPVLQFSYSPTPGFPVQPLDGFQSKIIVVQQPCNKHATNWTNNNLTNDVIIPIQTVSAENVAQSPIINSSPIKIPHDYSPSKSFLADNVGKFVTVTSETAPTNRKAGKKQSSKFTGQLSPAKDSHGKKRARRPPKKKRRPLFPPPKDPALSTENEICDNIPVLSIPDPSPNKDESMSAMEMLTSITEGKNIQSPLLKAVISSAKILAEKGGRLNSTHIRALEFSSPQTEEGNISKQCRNSADGDGRRSSPRLKQKKSCKSPCCSPLKSSESDSAHKKGYSKRLTKEKVDVTANLVTNAIEKLSAHKAVSSSMSNVVLNAMQDALQAKPVKSKKQDSSAAYDLFQRAEISLSPVKKTPIKCPSSGKKMVLPRDQYFPDSSSGSDSESDNIPLSAIVASKLKDTLKIKETKSSPLKKNNPQKSNVEKETVKNIVKEMPPSANMESVIKPMTNKDSEVSAAVPLNAKSSILSKTAVEKSNSIEDSEAPSNISKLVSPNKENKSSRKGSGSNRVKSKRLDHVQQETSKESKETKNVKPTQSCSSSEVTGNSPSCPIVLESDEDREMCEIGNENVASQMMCSTESKSSKKEQKEKLKKKKHHQKLTSISKEKTFSLKKSKKKNSPVSRKSNSPRIRETSEHLLQNKKPDSLTEKSNCKASKESCTEKEKQILCNKKSKTENSDIFQKLKEKANINETNSNPLSNEETIVPPPKSNCRTSQNSPMRKMQKNGQKGKWYISSPQKEKEVCNPSSFENNQNALGAIKKNRNIDELCDKLRLNAVQNSPRKEVTLKPLTEIDKLPDTMIRNSVEVSANETSLENDLFPSETIASVNPVENATLKLASIEILGEEKSTINAKVRNDITLDSEANINSTQSSVGNDPIKPNVKKRVLPPPKKRIRPVPVASPCDGSFSPFSPFSSPAHSVCFDSTLKPKEISRPSISRNPSDSEINKMVSCLPELHSPANVACLDSTSRPKEMPPLTRNTSNTKINETVSSAPLELNSPKNAICFDSPSKPKEMPSLSPVNVGAVRKCSSGKPKAMAEFYKSALPDRESDLPVSPDPMSSSSCTVDTFLARRNLPPAEMYVTSPNKENTLVNKISPEKKETKKVSQKRKLSSTSIKDSSDEEGLIKSPPRTETIIENTSVTETAPETAALLPSTHVQMKDVHLSSSDEEGLIKSPVKKLNCEQKSDQTAGQPEKKRKLSAGFSPHHETFTSNVSDQLKSNETDKSFSLHDKTVEKHQEEKLLVRHSTLKSCLKRSANPPMIPAGVKIPSKWNNSKINNYSNLITRYESEMGSKGPRRSRPNIKVVGFNSPLKTNSSFKRKNEHPSGLQSRPNTYRTLYSERQARRLQLENRRSPFRQSPNVNNGRSSAHHHRNESEMSFSKETTLRDYSKKKREHKDIPSRSSKTDCQEDGSRKHLSPYESSNNRNTSKYESPFSSSKISEKHFDNQESSKKHREKESVILLEKSNPVNENRDKLSYKNVEVPEKQKRNIPILKKSNENLHKQASSSNFCADEERKFITHNNKHILSKEKLISASNKHKLSVPEESNLLLEKDGMNLTAVPKLSSRLSYDKDTELELGTLSKERCIELRQESQLENPLQILDTEQNKQVCEKESDLNYNKIVDEAIGGISRTSTDQNELDQAVAFITNDEIPESQEPAISSQNIADGSKVSDNASDKNSEDFGALVIKQLSKAVGLSVPMQTEDISHLLDKIKEFGLENIAGIFGQKK